MVVGAKAAKDKSGSYYPVTILAKSFSAPKSRFPMVGGGGYADTTEIMQKDAAGKLYVSGGAVDVSNVMGKKLTSAIGGTGGAGSMIVPLTVVTLSTMESTGKVFLQVPLPIIMTTGTSYTVVKGTNTKLEGKAMPNDDNGKNVPTPLVGKPIDLNAGNGTLVGTTSVLGLKNKTMGMMDFLDASVWVMKITKQ
jgi:hypothetical protein